MYFYGYRQHQPHAFSNKQMYNLNLENKAQNLSDPILCNFFRS